MNQNQHFENEQNKMLIITSNKISLEQLKILKQIRLSNTEK